MISVVIPLYNKEKLIGNTLRSVLEQSYQDFEIVVVNDGSTDNSVTEVEKIADPHIRLIHQQNAGVSAARNKGISEAKGEFIALLDSDDLWKPEYLATQIELTRKYPQCDVFAVNYEFHDVKGNVSNTIIRKIPFEGDDGVLSNYFEVASCSHPPICSISIMTRKGVFEAIGGFPIGIKSGEDLLTWARLACQYKIAFSKKVCAIYNLGEGYDFANQPPRRQDIGDPVGKGLLNLYCAHKNMVGLRRYLSHWHKMRASVAVRFGDKKETICEVIKSFQYYPLNYKVLLFFILVFLPSKIRRCIISNHKS